MSLVINSAEFLLGARSISDFPKASGLYEYAFYGKSNCGKSSLINSVCQRKNLVKTSSRPGMTQEINFFTINDRFNLVDLPGVGYAKLGGQLRRVLGELISEYCHARPNLRIIFYLMDLRREPGEEQIDTLAFLTETRAQVVLVGTKADKLSNNELYTTQKSWTSFFNIQEDQLIVTSSEKHLGDAEIRALIQEDLQKAGRYRN